jgi:hypothetical protein
VLVPSPMVIELPPVGQVTEQSTVVVLPDGTKKLR